MGHKQRMSDTIWKAWTFVFFSQYSTNVDL